MKKTLSIILAILMIVTTIPMAFAAEATPDFSDAKAITEEDGKLYIDGAEAEIDGGYYLLNEGKYKLAENIFKSKYIWVAGEVALDLNGYVWDLGESNIVVNAPFSVYDTSADKNGKITSTFFCTIDTNNENGVFSLYSGTIENNSVYEDRMAISALWASVNLYGGKVTGNGYAVSVSSDYTIDKTLVLGDVVLESGEGYAQIKLSLRNYDDVKKMNIDVTDYTGESLETYVEAEGVGKFDVLKGVSSADEAEKYKLNVDAKYNNFHEKTEYDEEAGDVNIYIAKNAITQQPSAENCFTVDFNNPAATFQWYEVEETHLGAYITEERAPLFEYDFKAGDILKVSTDSELDLVNIETGAGNLELSGHKKTATVKFNADMTSLVVTRFLYAQNPVSLDFTVIKETALDGETGETLKNPECKKSYYCKATVNGRVYNSDTVVGHEIIQVEEKAPTCTEIGWEAYECTACDYTTKVEKEALNHKDTLVQVDAKAPACTEIGWESYEYCTACTYTTYVEKEALNHKDTLVKVDAKAPTCTEIGWEAYEYCTACTYTTYAEKEALNHKDTLVKVEAKAPTCTEIGWEAYEYCTACDYATTYVEFPATGEHIDADGDTMCDNGGEQLTCEDCSRPVHDDSFVQNLICMILMLINLIKTMF